MMFTWSWAAGSLSHFYLYRFDRSSEPEKEIFENNQSNIWYIYLRFMCGKSELFLFVCLFLTKNVKDTQCSLKHLPCLAKCGSEMWVRSQCKQSTASHMIDKAGCIWEDLCVCASVFLHLVISSCLCQRLSFSRCLSLLCLFIFCVSLLFPSGDCPVRSCLSPCLLFIY